ncbi:MAG: HD domain-containing protein [Deltaproteobacteria bacterium]|nr:HD domain-containing protein [Deltaproteobacteria bacterium]
MKEDVAPAAGKEKERCRLPFSVPTQGNKKLKKLLNGINNDPELLQLWRCANVNAVDRIGISDHGEIHIRIVANAALRILRLLLKGGVESSVVKHHLMENDDAEIIVVLAACLHDIGIAIHRDDHERYSLILAYPKARQLLSQLYEEPELTIVTAEVIHAVIAHNTAESCLTVEAGVLKVADTLDMKEGRSRIPFEAGQVNIHSVSAQAVEAVDILKGDSLPLKIVVTLSNSAGIFQVDELLRRKLRNSTLEPYVEVVAKIDGVSERKLIHEHRF